ncbi:MAG: nitrous oxide-stimulated promoter family protein [Dissulfurispiraceae bacterium]
MLVRHPRIAREEKTLLAMIRLYCRHTHSTTDKFCPDCVELMTYAAARLAHCPFQENKTTCVKCAVHCYKPVMRDKVRDVMRFSGPRMIYRHPVLAFFHFADGLRQPRKK